jgi:hypothetical protein
MTLQTSLQFTIEHEQNEQINYLDITIHRQQSNFGFDIYRKPTTTNHIIPNDSCHPLEHKLSAIQFLTNRVENTRSVTSRKKKNSIPYNISYKLTNTTAPTYEYIKTTGQYNTITLKNTKRKDEPYSHT